MSAFLDKSDLRQAGTAAKRVQNHKAKWVNGSRTKNPVVEGIVPKLRPLKGHPTSWNRQQRVQNTQRNYSLTKADFHNDVREALTEGTSDSSAVEDNDVSVPPVPEVSQHDGPLDYEVSGQMLFNDMVDKAVEKFEVKETEKLVKEYEIITRESEVSIGYLADEDEFELVDHVKL
ncbi:hypothetical protein BDV18DRAFT_35235 [Aspergillus unguis]